MLPIALPVLFSTVSAKISNSAFDELLNLRPPPGHPTLAPADVTPTPFASNWSLPIWLVFVLITVGLFVIYACTRSVTHCIKHNILWKADAAEEAEMAQDALQP